MMVATLSNEIACLLGGGALTNTEHPSMRAMLHRILTFHYHTLLSRHANEDDEFPGKSHLIPPSSYPHRSTQSMHTTSST